MKEINSLFQSENNIWVVHYASSNFENYPIRIASIALRRLTNNQTSSFSMNDTEYDDGKEKQILKDFFEHIKLNPLAKYLHWNMRDDSYGFAVVQNRFKSLFPNEELPFLISNEDKYDLSRILVEIYGDNYIDDPKLKTLVEKNSLNTQYFLEGKDEAEAFKNKQFSKIARSIKCKVNNLADLADLVYKKKLKTNCIRISSSSIAILAGIITGDNKELGHTYKTGQQLVDFFNQFGFSDIYSNGFPSRSIYVKEKLNKCNDTKIMSAIIKETLHSIHFNKKDSYDNAIVTLGDHLQKDGYQLLALEGGQRNVSIKSIDTIRTIQALSFKILNHECISEQIRKANDRLGNDDYSGVITIARSLVEECLKQIILKDNKEVPKWDGNIITLYKAARQALNLDASQKDHRDYAIKQMVGGLSSIVHGLSEMRNKMSDSHAPTHKPSKLHAKLAINAAFTLCEFLVDSLEYQPSRKK